MIRPLPLIALLGLGAAAGCKTPTEVVVRLVATGNPPAMIVVQLHRSIPFNDNPTGLPPFVTPFLDGANLDLQVAPPGDVTVISLLPSASGPSDLMVSASAVGYAVDPAAAQDGAFAAGVSKTLTFTFTALPPPDMGARDAAPKHDLSAIAVDMPIPTGADGAPSTDGPAGD